MKTLLILVFPLALVAQQQDTTTNKLFIKEYQLIYPDLSPYTGDDKQQTPEQVWVLPLCNLLNEGKIIYDKADRCFKGCDGSKWIKLTKDEND